MGSNDGGALSAMKKAFADGFDAFSVCDEERKMPVANPYPARSVLAKEWQRGFDRGYYENSKRVDVV